LPGPLQRKPLTEKSVRGFLFSEQLSFPVNYVYNLVLI